jgi:hypothetical protein
LKLFIFSFPIPGRKKDITSAALCSVLLQKPWLKGCAPAVIYTWLQTGKITGNTRYLNLAQQQDCAMLTKNLLLRSHGGQKHVLNKKGLRKILL